MRKTGEDRTSKTRHQSVTSVFSTGRGSRSVPAFRIRTSQFLNLSAALPIAASSATSAAYVDTDTDANSFWMLSAVSDRKDCVRPIRTTCEAPAAAKALALSAPIPRPPPVTMTVLLATESSWRVGEMAS